MYRIARGFNHGAVEFLLGTPGKEASQETKKAHPSDKLQVSRKLTLTRAMEMV